MDCPQTTRRNQFTLRSRATRSVRRKAQRSDAASHSGPALTPYSARSNARAVMPDGPTNHAPNSLTRGSEIRGDNGRSQGRVLRFLQRRPLNRHAIPARPCSVALMHQPAEYAGAGRKRFICPLALTPLGNGGARSSGVSLLRAEVLRPGRGDDYAYAWSITRPSRGRKASPGLTLTEERRVRPGGSS